MAAYAFLTTWVLAAPVERVREVLVDVERWPEWFPAMRRVEVEEPGGEDGTGAVLALTVRALLPYDLAFRIRITRADPLGTLDFTALGDLDGTGRWTLTEREGATTARFEWRVATTKRWMAALAPVARPLFALNHDLAMAAAGQGLARHLGVPLLAGGSRSIARRA